MDTLGKAYMGVPMAKRKRRAFTREFKAETVRLVLEGGRSIPEVAREMDLTESALRLWVHQAKVDRGQGKPGELTTAEREELQRLRRENKDLRIEREILKKAAAFFAKEIQRLGASIASRALPTGPCWAGSHFASSNSGCSQPQG